ncbi:MAG: hypothetical protein ABL907_03155, partial [Hyphomicrobium sp.]
ELEGFSAGRSCCCLNEVSSLRSWPDAYVLTKALVMLAKMRGTSVEYEVMRYNVDVAERRLLMPVKPALPEEERVARVKACKVRAVEKARLKRAAARGPVRMNSANQSPIRNRNAE